LPLIPFDAFRAFDGTNVKQQPRVVCCHDLVLVDMFICEEETLEVTKTMDATTRHASIQQSQVAGIAHLKCWHIMQLDPCVYMKCEKTFLTVLSDSKTGCGLLACNRHILNCTYRS